MGTAIECIGKTFCLIDPTISLSNLLYVATAIGLYFSPFPFPFPFPFFIQLLLFSLPSSHFHFLFFFWLLNLIMTSNLQKWRKETFLLRFRTNNHSLIISKKKEKSFLPPELAFQFKPEENGKWKKEKWKNGKMEKWKNGKMEKWKSGKMEKGKKKLLSVLILFYFFPFLFKTKQECIYPCPFVAPDAIFGRKQRN